MLSIGHLTTPTSKTGILRAFPKNLVGPLICSDQKECGRSKDMSLVRFKYPDTTSAVRKPTSLMEKGHMEQHQDIRYVSHVFLHQKTNETEKMIPAEVW